MQTLPLTRRVTSGKTLTCAAPQFPHVSNGALPSLPVAETEQDDAHKAPQVTSCHLQR